MYQNLLKVAQDIAMQKQNTGQVTPNDTICVISAASKRIYAGVNHTEMQNGMMINMHAEIDAVQQMRAGGDTVAEFLLLVSTITLQPILPCSGCIGFILGQAPENANCQVVLPDRMIPLPQIGQINGSNSLPFNNAMPAGGGSMYMNNPYGAPMGSMYGAPPQGSMYGQPQGSMYGQPQGSVYGQGSIYGQGSVYGQNSMPYNGANPAGGSMYTSSMYGNQQGGGAYVGAHPAKPKKSANSKLKGRVGSLLNAGQDIGADEEPENELFKKLFKK